MKVGIPKETFPGETRVSMIPEVVKRLSANGMEFIVEKGAGVLAGYHDADYEAAGATLQSDHASVLASDIVLKVQRPGDGSAGEPDEVGMLKEGATLISFLQPFANPALIEKLAAAKITAMSMEMVPRITKAQNMDVLSSMATVSGYKAVLLAANEFSRFFPMFMTAAGTIPPARTLVLGAGVAGLQAIATAKRLGAVVEAFDTRPVVKEQVESLGAKFVGLDLAAEGAEDAGGYAKELSQDQHQKELDLIASRLPRIDIIITTAAIPGKKAPLLITEEMLKTMKPGSIVVDLAAETGGNCALTEAGEISVHHEVKLIGLTNLAALMPTHASQMYAKNMGNLMAHLVSEGELVLDFEEPITAGMVVTHQGQVVHPALKKS